MRKRLILSARSLLFLLMVFAPVAHSAAVLFSNDSFLTVFGTAINPGGLDSLSENGTPQEGVSATVSGSLFAQDPQGNTVSGTASAMGFWTRNGNQVELTASTAVSGAATNVTGNTGFVSSTANAGIFLKFELDQATPVLINGTRTVEQIGDALGPALASVSEFASISAVLRNDLGLPPQFETTFFSSSVATLDGSPAGNGTTLFQYSGTLQPGFYDFEFFLHGQSTVDINTGSGSASTSLNATITFVPLPPAAWLLLAALPVLRATRLPCPRRPPRSPGSPPSPAGLKQRTGSPE